MTVLEMPTIKEVNDVISDYPQSEAGLYVSEERYWQDYYEHPDFSYEWNNGYLEAKPVADYVKAQIYFWFLELLRLYLHRYPIARLTGLEIGFRMALPHKTAIRKPDLGLVLNNNPVPLGDHDRTYKGIFDLCVESLSDSSRKEIERDTVKKRGEYEMAMVQEYYILDDKGKEMAFLSNVGGIYQPLTPINGVIQSRVLPGFQFRITDLHRQPWLTELAEDPVYQGFVLPEYQAERQEKEQERRRAEREHRRAERERQEKERLAAKLRALGIDPEAD